MKIKFLIAILFIIGIGLLAYSYSIPFWTDEKLKKDWDNKAADNLGNKDWEAFKNDYYKNIGPLRTRKIDFMDLGAGLISFSVSIFFLMFFFRLSGVRDFLFISTPKKKYMFFILANVGWLLMMPAGFVYYTLRQQRGDYPWFADSIAIPIFSGAMFVLIMLPLVNLHFGIFTYFAEYPAELKCRFKRYIWKDVAIEMFFALFSIMNSFAIYEFVMDGDFLSLPISILFLYLLLSTRAGFIKRTNAKREASTQQTICVSAVK